MAEHTLWARDVDAATASAASTHTFETALVFNAAVFAIELVAFTLLYKRFRAIYEPRSYIPHNEE